MSNWGKHEVSSLRYINLKGEFFMKQYDGKSKTTNQMDVYQTLKTKFYEQEATSLLDSLTYSFNKKHLQILIDKSLDQGDKQAFIQYSTIYNQLLENKLCN